MHWDHEPTPNPSQEGNAQDADGCLFPSREGSGVGRFRERACLEPQRPHLPKRPGMFRGELWQRTRCGVGHPAVRGSAGFIPLQRMLLPRRKIGSFTRADQVAMRTEARAPFRSGRAGRRSMSGQERVANFSSTTRKELVSFAVQK